MTATSHRLDVARSSAARSRTLVVAQAVGALGITIGIATASLLARDISGSERQAGLAQTFQVLGAAVASYLLARLMSRRGRRVGLATGLPARRRRRRCSPWSAGVVDSMALLLVGAALLGADDGGQQRRPRTPPPTSRQRSDPGPGAVDRGVGDHDRRRRRPQPDRAGRRRRRRARASPS